MGKTYPQTIGFPRQSGMIRKIDNSSPGFIVWGCPNGFTAFGGAPVRADLSRQNDVKSFEWIFAASVRVTSSLLFESLPPARFTGGRQTDIRHELMQQDESIKF
jgi:hypothetical protein